MNAGGSGVKLDDGPDLKLFIKGPKSFSLLHCLSGPVPGKSFGVKPQFGMRFTVKNSRVCLDFRPDIADIKCTTTNRCSTSESLLLQIFTVVELLFRDIKL